VEEGIGTFFLYIYVPRLKICNFSWSPILQPTPAIRNANRNLGGGAIIKLIWVVVVESVDIQLPTEPGSVMVYRTCVSRKYFLFLSVHRYVEHFFRDWELQSGQFSFIIGAVTDEKYFRVKKNCGIILFLMRRIFFVARLSDTHKKILARIWKQF
jgi:hypothetical protein